jgi:GNAT superfamily N-acetyltransferase
VSASVPDADSDDPDVYADRVFTAEVVRFEFGGSDVYNLADEHSAGLEWVVGTLADSVGNLRHDALNEAFYEGKNSVLVVSDAYVEPGYEGLGVGRWLILEVLDMLGEGCALTAWLATGEGDSPESVSSLDGARLRRALSEVGFEHFEAGVMVLPMISAVFEERLAELREAFGQPF